MREIYSILNQAVDFATRFSNPSPSVDHFSSATEGFLTLRDGYNRELDNLRCVRTYDMSNVLDMYTII